MTVKKIKNLKKAVFETLDRYPLTRNSDVFLTLMVWYSYFHEDIQQIDGKWFVSFEALQYLPREDHIGRVRRKIQEEGHFPPTDHEVAKQRGYNEEEWRKAMGANPELRQVI